MGAGASSQISSASEVDLTAVIAALSAKGKAKLAAALSEQDNPPSRDYFDVDALLDSVESGAIAPLRGSWVVKLHEEGGTLKRRQDLPPEAFWSAADLRKVAQKLGDNFGVLFVALSYR